MFTHAINALRNYEYGKYLLTFQQLEFRSSWEVSAYLQNLFTEKCPCNTFVCQASHPIRKFGPGQILLTTTCIKIADINKWWAYYSLIAGLLSSIYIYICGIQLARDRDATNWYSTTPQQQQDATGLTKSFDKNRASVQKKNRHVLFGAPISINSEIIHKHFNL